MEFNNTRHAEQPWVSCRRANAQHCSLNSSFTFRYIEISSEQFLSLVFQMVAKPINAMPCFHNGVVINK